MKTNLVLISSLAAMALGAGPAFAGGSEGSVGVGAEEIVNLSFGAATLRLGAVSVDYDAGKFNVGGFTGFYDGGGQDDSLVFLGGRFYFHVASTSMADFGLGASGFMGFIGDGNPNTDNSQVMFLEPGFQVRAFIASNVALSFTGGITLGLLDAEGVSIGGDPVGSAGFHYYFF
jgi:hypothetical protein